MRVIAFDLGSTMAYAMPCQDEAGGVLVSHQVFTGRRAGKLHAITEWLADRMRAAVHADIDAVAFERPFARGQAATRMLWGVAGIIEAAAEKAGLPVVDVDPSTIKVFAAGKGRADKEDMKAAAYLLGYVGDNEHEADAYCLMRFAETNGLMEAVDDQ